MGIADDIRPKKYRSIGAKAEKAAIKKAKKEIDNRDDGRLFKQSEDGDFFGGTPISHTTNSEPKKHNLKWLYTLVIILAIASLIGLVVWQNYAVIKSYFDGSYKKNNNQNLNQIIDSAGTKDKNYESSEPQSPATETATQTPVVPTIDKKTINISVLNGSGIKNSAQTVAGTLSTAGFTVSATANARSFNYQKTLIYYKTGGEAKAELVKAALANYQTESVLSDPIVGTNYDIVVVVGKS